MGHGQKVSCALCHGCHETKTTGPLSTKDQVTAHQNCLLFSSGIFCRDSPRFDDLFGFSVEDVMDEVKRGSKLVCSRCKKKGATAGCEVKRCKKSYHYPCAVQDGAETVEDADTGKYELYCFKHSKKIQENNGSVNGNVSSLAKPGTSKNPGEAASSKVYCLACEKTEGNISLESLSNSILILYCDKHAPTSHKRNINGDSTVAGRSAYSSDSNSSSSTKHLSSKRRLPFSDKSMSSSDIKTNKTNTSRREGTPSKRKSEAWSRIIPDTSDSDENELDEDMEMYAPLESDLEGSANSVPEVQSIRKDAQSPIGSTSGYRDENESRNGNQEDDDTDVESESLLPPVGSSTESQSLSTARAAQTTQTLYPPEVVKTEGEGSCPVQSPVPQQGSAGPPPSPDHSKPRSITGSPPHTSSSILQAPPVETECVTVLSSPESLVALHSDPEPSIDSASFWKSCNMAGCTKNIFEDFINEITDISSRIQSDQASQEDYDLALKMMKASGKLAELVTKQQKELQRKQMELQKAMNAMIEVVSAVSR